MAPSRGSCDSQQPDWSPDGTQIAFETPCFDGGANIGVMPAGGGAATAVALYPIADAGYPSWSPDGTEIVFTANEGMGSEQLWESSPSNPGDNKTVTATQLTFDSGQPYNTTPSWQPVHHAHLALSTGSAAPGATVTVTGSDFLAEQTVKLSFVDAHGTTTALGSAKTPLNGGFSATVTIPAGAAAGTGKIKATGAGGLSAVKTLNVTQAGPVRRCACACPVGLWRAQAGRLCGEQSVDRLRRAKAGRGTTPGPIS